MQTHDPQSQSPGVLNHPSAEEWMQFLYGELSPERRRELAVHLRECTACAGQVKDWRASMTALDEWILPAVRRIRSGWQPVLRWAAAAAVILTAGFAIGRQTSTAASEVAALKSSVTQLTERMERERLLTASNSMSAAIVAANAEAIRLLSEYATLDETRQAEERQTLAAALRDFDLRLARLRAELETVAVNTEDGFQQTQDNLTWLALAAYDDTKPDQIP